MKSPPQQTDATALINLILDCLGPALDHVFVNHVANTRVTAGSENPLSRSEQDGCARTCPPQLIATYRKFLPVECRHLSALVEEHMAQLAFAQRFADLLKCEIRQ